MRTALALIGTTLMACSSSEQGGDEADSTTPDATSETSSVDSGASDGHRDVAPIDSQAPDSGPIDAHIDTSTSDATSDAMSDADVVDVHDADASPADTGIDVGASDASDASDAAEADTFSGCVIASVSYAPGTPSPSGCGTCDPATITTDWTSLPKGTSCGSGMYCDGFDSCVPGCIVGGTFYVAGETDPSSACRRCDPSKTTSTFSAAFFQEPATRVETWTSPPTPPAGTAVYHVVAADFDHDSVSDVVASEAGGAALTLLTGKSGGGFASPVRTSTPGFTSTDLKTADMNGDTWPDVVALAPNVAFQLYTGGSGGVLTESGSSVGTYAFSNALAIADTNGDGSLDVAVNGGSGTGAGLVAYYPASAGGFTSGPTHTLGVYVPVFALADVDKDGKTDLAMGDAYGGWSLYLSKTGYASGAVGRTGALAFADLDGDTVPDLVFGNNGTVPGGWQVSVFFLSSSGAIVKSQDLPGVGPATTFAFDDVDHDGKLDVLFMGGGGLGVLLNGSTLGSPSFTEVTPHYLGIGGSSLATGDFDGDGAIDVVGAGGFTKTQITVLYGCK